MLRAACLLLAVCASSSAALGLPRTASVLDSLSFYSPSTLSSSYRCGVVVSVASLNDGLWASANATSAEAPFISSTHARGLETCVNTSAAATCTGAATNLSNAGGVATLPTDTAADGSSVFLQKVYGLSFDECVSHCCTAARCAAIAWYSTSDAGELCQTFTAAYSLGPQPWPAGSVLAAQGAVLATPPSDVDAIANGLRAGVPLGGLATGGYELRADGSFHLSTLRGQSPASEPWQGTVRDAVLAVAVDGEAYVVRLAPFGGLSPVPALIWSAAVPVARLQFLGSLALYAYSPLVPGDANASATPAALFTLTAVNTGAAPMSVSFAVLQPLAARSDWAQTRDGAPAPGAPSASAAACAAACVATASTCYAWQWAAAAGCVLDTRSYALGANAAGVDSGHPGLWTRSADSSSVRFSTTVVPGAGALHNALGEQGLYVLEAVGGATASSGAAAAATADALLAALQTADAGAALRALPVGLPNHLHAAAAATVGGIAPGATACISIAHAWHYPKLFWYRDVYSGSDVGQYYAANFADATAVATSLNASRIAAALLAWQHVFAGLPDALARDAVFNFFAHARSAMWLRSGEYRQWESLEFVDYANPTNNNERALPYFALWPETMASQLRTWIDHAQNADGSFYCILVSASGDRQWGAGDPCGTPSPSNPHPDDVAMVLVAAYEQLALGNESALIAAIYPALVRGFAYYKAAYNTSAWGLPYRVHETYDAVPESASITGEGNLGTSLFNALQYINALHCVRALAASAGDAATGADADALIARATAAVQRHLWQAGAPFFIGDTLAGNALLLEPNGWPYHSSDGLHGQVLAYRLGFGALLPPLQMALHQAFVSRDLNTTWGLRFDTFAQQNWLMSDHAHSALLLAWNEVGAWDASLSQLRYFRDAKAENTRLTAVVDTRTGQPALLNFYGYGLFFYHTLPAFVGLVADLPARSLAISPHYSAFTAGAALLPLALGGYLGTVALTPTSASLSLAFARGGNALSFLRIAICQFVFDGSPDAPLVVPLGGAPLVLPLPSACDRANASAARTLVSTPYCAPQSPLVVDATSAWSQVPPPSSVLPGLSLAACSAAAAAHHWCGFDWDADTLDCGLVPGSACYIVPHGRRSGGGGNHSLGAVLCSYASAGYSPPVLVNTSHTTVSNGASFADFAPLDSAVYSMVLPSEAACAAHAATQQACGWLWVADWGAAAPLGSCGGGIVPAPAGCCVLNPYAGCSVGPPAALLGTVGVFDGGSS